MNADNEIDPRDRITPNAFRVAPHLIGLPLATPWRRGSAILIDLLLVAILAQTQWLLLAVAPAAASFGWLKKRRAGAAVLRWSIAIIVFGLVTAAMVPSWESHRDDEPTPAADSDGLTLSGTEGIRFGAGVARLHACDDADCRRAAVEAIAEVLAESATTAAKGTELVEELVKDVTADERERAALLALAQQHLQAPAATIAPHTAAPTAPLPEAPEEEKEHGRYSLIGLLESLADDLGFSIGWAAVYFSYFPGAWRGQTPGKRLFGLRTVRLNGKPLSYWDSFNRYGGYAAGFATGLIGFLQVFWDANRQAIHDQISFTAVIHDPDGDALQRAQARYEAQSKAIPAPVGGA